MRLNDLALALALTSEFIGLDLSLQYVELGLGLFVVMCDFDHKAGCKGRFFRLREGCYVPGALCPRGVISGELCWGREGGGVLSVSRSGR